MRGPSREPRRRRRHRRQRSRELSDYWKNQAPDGRSRVGEGGSSITPIKLSDFARLCGGVLSGDPETTFSDFATDSRAVKSGDLFIAIPGANVDGHDFVGLAIEKGAVAALVERPVGAPHILVSKIEKGLASFGRNIRLGFEGPVIGVTGSAGKTTTKEFVAAALASNGAVLKTSGNRNTEYTSPLVWAELTPETKFAVIEMAMRGFGQIAHLAKISLPTVGIVTNIGYSHLLQVGDRVGIARAKGELLEALPETGSSVLWREDDFYSELLKMGRARNHYSFGFSEGANCQIVSYQSDSWTSSQIRGTCFGQPWTATLPAVGRHIALDAAAAVLTASICGVEAQVAASALEKVVLPPMRMEIREVNGATVLLDTYNASPPAMLAAIESIDGTPATGRKLAILGQMLELGDSTEEAHRSIGKAVEASDLDAVVFVGDSMKYAMSQVAAGKATFAEDDNPLKTLVASLEPGDVLLIKGSRALQLERILSL